MDMLDQEVRRDLADQEERKDQEDHKGQKDLKVRKDQEDQKVREDQRVQMDYHQISQLKLFNKREEKYHALKDTKLLEEEEIADTST